MKVGPEEAILVAHMGDTAHIIFSSGLSAEFDEETTSWKDSRGASGTGAGLLQYLKRTGGTLLVIHKRRIIVQRGTAYRILRDKGRIVLKDLEFEFL